MSMEKCTEPKIRNVYLLIRGELFEASFSWTNNEWNWFNLILNEYFKTK